MGPRGADDDEAKALAALEALYHEVDAVYAATRCPGSTECCRFARTGREPYVTPLELRLVLRAIRARGGRLPRAPEPLHRRLPTFTELDETFRELDDEGPCPLLDPTGRCGVYAARPFGCRTFFCERARTDRFVPHREMLALLGRLKALSGPLGSEGRPLTRALRGVTGLSTPAEPGRRGRRRG